MGKRKKVQDMKVVAKTTKSKVSYQLAINIIEEQFGPLAKTVAEVMSRFDNMKLKDIVNILKVTNPKSDVAKQETVELILAAFSQHNILLDMCVDEYESNNTTFTLDVDAIIFRLRCDKMRHFLQHVKYKNNDIKGIAAAEIFRVLWRAGRMQKSVLTEKVEKSLSDSGMKKVTDTIIRDTINELYDHEYIYDVPKAINPLSIANHERSKKARKTETSIDRSVAIAMDKEEATAPIRVNTDRFFRSFRISGYREKCDEFIDHNPLLESKDEASRLMQCFFDIIETKFQGRVTETVKSGYLVDGSTDRRMTQSVLSSLIIPSSVNIPTLLSQRSEGKDVWYYFSWKKVLERMRRDIIVNIVEEQFGTDHNRIFRLLLDSTYIEEKQVSHRALIEPKKTRQVLYDMFRGGYLKMQEVPKKSDYNAQTTLYLWNVPIDDVVERHVQHLIFMMLNLRIKRTSVYETNWDLIDRFQREIVNKEEEKAATETYEVVQKHLTALLVQIHRLDDTLLCLGDTTDESFLRIKRRQNCYSD